MWAKVMTANRDPSNDDARADARRAKKDFLDAVASQPLRQEGAEPAGDLSNDRLGMGNEMGPSTRVDWPAVLADPAAQPASEARVTAAARVLCKRNADACGVNFEDSWKVYGGDFKDDARAALAAAEGAKT
jgi:hypothetical protein